MKKNFTVNISGILFNIDEDAYKRLQAYLDQLKKHFDGTSGKDEIISDIESRIAEMMQEMLGPTKNVITLEDIQEIVKQMGEPSEFEDETEEQSQETKYESEPRQRTYKTAKRFFRDPDNKIVGGVAGGLGAFFGLDPVWIRLLFIVAVFFGGTGFFIYLILWAIIPEATSTAQKLEMRGEPVNIDNIEKSIESELSNIGNKLNEIKDKHFKKKSELNIFEKFAHFIIQLFQGLFKFVVGVIGAGFAIVALTLIIFYFSSLFSGNEFMIHRWNGVGPFVSIPNMLDMIFVSASEVNLVLTGLSIVVLIPLIGIIYGGARTLFGFKWRIPNMGLSFFIIWITGVILLAIGGVQAAGHFSTHGEQSVEHQIKPFESDTLFLQIGTNPLPEDMILHPEIDLHDAIDAKFAFFQDENNFYNVPDIRFRDSDDNNFHLVVKTTARGHNLSDANKNADHTNYSLKVNENLITMAPYYSFPKEDRWRAQTVKLYIYVPEGKHIKYIPQKTYSNYFQRAVDGHYKYMLKYSNYYHDGWEEKNTPEEPVEEIPEDSVETETIIKTNFTDSLSREELQSRFACLI